MSRRFVGVALVALVASGTLALAPTAAFGQARGYVPPKVTDPILAEAKRLFDQGATAYGTGNYEDAIRYWEQAYKLSLRPLILDNIANAWEKLGNLRKTREYLARWRDAAPPEEQTMLDMRLRTLDARIAREDEAAAEAKAAADKAAREAALRNAPPPPPARPWLPGAILAGAGGVVVIVGVAIDGVAASKRPPAASCAPDGSLNLCQSSASSAISTSNHLAVAGDATWILGAVAAAAGVTWALLPRRVYASASASTWISPTLGGATVGGSF